ncbi:DUF2807 domain-containing protein [Brevundimonas sp. S1H14]|uniref:GIN domain-containing protein n=1 Tax=Brevundimonas sp. S1H14 TaxID=3078084 RepID=UPI0039E80BE6
MKPAAIAAALGSALAASAVLAAPAFAAEVTIRNAVARVIVIPEDRADVGVEITQGSADLPELRIERRGDQVRIDGGLGRSRGMGFNSGLIGSCNNGRADARQPGDGATVEVRGKGRIRMEDAPMIVLRTPRDVDVNGGGAVFGSIGRGARSVDLGSGGCGSWTVANVEETLGVVMSGSGNIRTGTSSSLDISVSGSGSISAGATRDLDISSSGSGNVTVASMNGDADISISGSGDIWIRNGQALSLEAAINGSGNVRFDGTARSVEAAIAGSGNVRVSKVTGLVSRAVVGSGDLQIGG